MRQPAWDSKWNHPVALGELLVQPLIWPVAIFAYGITEFPRGQIRHLRFLVKTVRTGKTGPYQGVIW